MLVRAAHRRAEGEDIDDATRRNNLGGPAGGRLHDGSQLRGDWPTFRSTASGYSPESITSDAQGNHLSRQQQRHRSTACSKAALRRSRGSCRAQTNGLTSVFGVFADDNRGLLWVCNNPGFGGPPQPGAKSSLKAFDIVNGELMGGYDFPAGAPAACNDIAIRGLATTFASETSGGRIFKLEPGGQELELYVADPELVGIDGIAFGDDGEMYINNVRKNTMQRVDHAANGSMPGSPR